MFLIAALLVAMQQQAPLVAPYFDRELEEAAFRRALTLAEIDGTVTSERAVTTSPVELWHVNVAGRGDVDTAAFFLELVSIRDWRVFELDSFHADGETFTARFVIPVFDPDGLTRERTEIFEKLKGRPRLVDARALLDAWPDANSSLRLTGADIDDKGIRLRGVALGAAARSELLAQIRSAGFAVPRMQLAPSGACRPFVLVAERGSGPTKFETDAKLRSPLCDDAAGPATLRISARGTSGPLNASLRNIEMAEVFQLLSEITGASFILDPDVNGRVDLQLEKATLDEALAAIPGVVIGPAPLRRVSREAKPGLTQNYTGERITMLLTDANLASVLCLFEDITSLKMRIRPNTRETVTVYARDEPWDRILDAMLASASLTYKIDGIQVFIGPSDGAVASCEAAAKSISRFTSAPLTVDRLGRSDIEVAGVVQQDGKWKAYLHGPRHRFWLVEEGQKLFDATVKSIGPAGVVFE